MKPNFALTLSFEGIGLLHRAATGWERIADVPLDVEDLPKALDSLKKTASDLTNEPLQSKLLLPAEQIKYIRLSDPSGGTQAQEAAVRTALDGATPYTLDELAYDWAESDGSLLVAAVARETLLEAETFARDNGFEPVYFAAKPEAGEFVGEPFFGPCETAAHLGPVERDTEAVVISGVARLPDPTEDPEPAPQKAAPQAKADAPTETAPSAEDDAPEAEPEAPPAFSTRRAEATEGASPALSGASRAATSAVAPTISLPGLDEAPEEATPPLAPPMPRPAPDAPTDKSTMSFVSRRADDDETDAEPPEPREARDAPALPAPPPSVLPPTTTEKQRLTVFGARKPETPKPQRAVAGKPRFLGLILTAVLLVFLLGVAAWASIFVGDGLARFLGKDRTQGATALPNYDETEIEGEEAMLPVNPLELASLAPDEALGSPQPSTAPLSVPALTLEEAQEKYAVTGIWAFPPVAPETPTTLSQDDLYIASIDSAIGAQDAIALPPLALEQVDGAIAQQSNPSAQGQQFALDARGLVIATPEGSMSPDGHMVFAGKPPYFPENLPDRTVAVAAVEPVVDPLAQFRPKLRPEGLQVANERANLGGLTRTELATIRPKLRPPSATQIAAAVPQPDAGAALEEAIEEAVAMAVPPTAGGVVIRLPQADTRDLDPNATEQAVARSIKPKDRPNNFDRIVKRAEKAQEAEEVTQVAAVAPRTVAPSIPSRSSVTKQATVRNAINLRRVNLIGVYGKPSSRRALVRLSNGRYKKVAVGDRIDGGRVSAIGEEELRYQKNGRDVTLKMPRG